MLRCTPDRLHSLSHAIFTAVGSDDREAGLISDHLVEANLTGHDSHGVGLIPLYVHFAGDGQVTPNRHAEITLDAGPVLVVDGRRGFGQVIAYETMEMTIARARDHGVALSALRNSFHIGRIGHWGEQCARAGLASIHFVNVVGHEPLVAPHGGRSARFATNPVCIALPGESGVLSILDMATSKIALGKARVARNAGVEAPAGTLLDAAGEPTVDPSVMFADPLGALLPMGEHKGSGLAIMAELLAGALGGGTTMQPDHPRPGGPINSMLSVVIDPATVGDPRFLHSEAQAFLDYVKTAPPRAGLDEVYVPGELEDRRRVERRRDGIPLAEGAWAAISDTATGLGIDAAAVALPV